MVPRFIARDGYMDRDTEEIIMDIPTVKNGHSFSKPFVLVPCSVFMSAVFGLLNKRFQKMGAQ